MPAPVSVRLHGKGNIGAKAVTKASKIADILWLPSRNGVPEKECWQIRGKDLTKQVGDSLLSEIIYMLVIGKTFV